VETGHRRMTAELRAPTRGGAARAEGSDGADEPRSPSPEPRRAATEPVRDNPFDDLEVPGWLGG